MAQRRGIGANQGRVLGMLVLMHPRPVEATILARMADVMADLTRGNRVLETLEVRGLIVRDSIGRSVDKHNALRWRITAEGTASFYVWFIHKIGERGGIAR